VSADRPVLFTDEVEPEFAHLVETAPQTTADLLRSAAARPDAEKAAQLFG
jgi:hypothetical protein